MRTTVVFFALLATAFAADPQNVLPSTPVALHGTFSAWDAYQAVAKILGVKLFAPAVLVPAGSPKPDQDWHVAYKQQFAELRSTSITLNLENATGEQAFDAITTFTRMQWLAYPSSLGGLDKSKPVFVSVYAK